MNQPIKTQKTLQIGDIITVDIGYPPAELYTKGKILEIRKHKDLFDPNLEKTSLYITTPYGNFDISQPF